MRLDQYLLHKKLVPTREKGRALIMAGLVYVGGQKADKAGMPVDETAAVEIRGAEHSYASRGGLKLEKAFDAFSASPKGLVCMDIGASTGGFTDCLLQNGAQKVYAVDVGYGQLAWELRNDPRVIVMERCNIRNIKPEDICDSVDFFTIDVSFISLKLVLPAVKSIAKPNCKVICLVKPQFEAGKGKVGKKGVVRDPDIHAEVLQNVLGYARENGFSVSGLDYSPIKGPQGNIEYLLFLNIGNNNSIFANDMVNNVINDAHRNLS